MHESEPQHIPTQPTQTDGLSDVAKHGQDQSTTSSQPPKKPLSFYIACVVALLALALGCALGYQSCSNTSEGRDPNAALGQLEGKSPEEIQAELDRIVEEGMLNISIASVVEFADGTAPGELAIENVANNHYLVKVEITRDDTGEVIFNTGFIEPNHHIQHAKLNVDLDAGTYACTAVFSGYDPQTEELVGQAGANITVVVQG